ncbi:MAG: hypothetical protein MI919_24555, partial [Holophagales bacterium]|nr:hypothetical protein [Holophagales bacterium]
MTTTFVPSSTFDPRPSPFPPPVSAAEGLSATSEAAAGSRGGARPDVWKHISTSLRAFLAQKRADARLRWALSAPAAF